MVVGAAKRGRCQKIRGGKGGGIQLSISQGRRRWGRNVHSGLYPGGEDVCATVAQMGQVRLHLGLLCSPLDGSLFRQIHWMDYMNETCPVGLLADRFEQHPEKWGILINVWRKERM